VSVLEYNLLMLPEFRIVNKIAEVTNALARCESEGYELLLWQNINDKRVQTTCSIHHYSKNNNLKIELVLAASVKFDNSKDFFLYQEDLKFLFKGSFSIETKSKLILDLDNKLYLKENRESTRFIFENVSFEVTLDYIDQSTQKKKTFKAELVDISDSGFSFIVPASRSTSIYENMQISLRCLESIKFSKPIIGNIRYNIASKVKFGVTDIKYGVSFRDKSPAIATAMKLFKEKMN